MIKVKVNLDICTKCRLDYCKDWDLSLRTAGMIAYNCPKDLGTVEVKDPFPPESCPKIFEHLVAAGLSVNIDKIGGDVNG